MENGPEQHRCVTVGKHKAIAVGPDRVLWIELHDTVPERINQRGKRHWRAWMTGFRLLHGIHRKGADGVDTHLIEALFCKCLGELCNSHTRLSAAPSRWAIWVSSSATFRRRRRCRSAWLNWALRNASTSSRATDGPTTLPPIQTMFMSSSS